MKRVNDVLKVKGHDVWSIGSEASVKEGIQLLADKDVGALMVVDDAKLVGIFSERDYARQVILKGRYSEKTQIKEIMTTRILYAQLEQEVEECMALMTAMRVRHLPVIDEEELLGVVSIGDLVKSVIDEQRYTIDQLEQYIKGS